MKYTVWYEGVSIPQAVWIACNKQFRYYAATLRRFNTASGMDCMQFVVSRMVASAVIVSIPQAVWIACNATLVPLPVRTCVVSIPQAVWIACNIVIGYVVYENTRFNTASGMDCMQ